MWISYAPSAAPSAAASAIVVERHLVGALFALAAGERAELAAVAADVGGVDVAVDHEVDAVAVDAAAREVGHLPDAEEVVARVERDAVLAGEALAREDLLGDRGECGSESVNEVMRLHP